MYISSFQTEMAGLFLKKELLDDQFDYVTIFFFKNLNYGAKTSYQLWHLCWMTIVFIYSIFFANLLTYKTLHWYFILFFLSK